MKIKARIYGSQNKMGSIKEFEVVDALPEKGELVDMFDPGYIWDEPEPVLLDPEQRTGDDDEHVNYSFYVVYDIDAETGERSEPHWMAVKIAKPKYRSQAKYDAEHTRQIRLKLNLQTDEDILEWLDRQPNKQGAIKALIRDAIESEK